MKRLALAAAATALCAATVFGADWATDKGSAFAKGQKNVSVGLSLFWFGFTGSFDYGFHEAISGGGAIGYNGHATLLDSINYLPIMGRAAFHPFNLAVIAEKIPVRDKLDVYVGLTAGARIGWASYKGSRTGPANYPNVGVFYVREMIGARWYFTDMFGVFLEEGSGMGTFNSGITLKF